MRLVLTTTSAAIVLALALSTHAADIMPPPTPTAVAVRLEWDPIFNPALTGYRLYFGPIGTQGYSHSTNLPPTVTNAVVTIPFLEYRWTITSLAGLAESAASNVVTNKLLSTPILRIGGEATFIFELKVPLGELK